MANSYLTFSEVLPRLTGEEESWLRSQLAIVCVFGDREYLQDELPEHLTDEPADWVGCRAWQDMPDHDEDGEVGFQYAFDDDHDPPDGRGRHLWVYGEEWGDPWRVAHLIQKLLQTFRPDACWSITYALTCSKLRAREFGGGGIFVSATEISTHDGHDIVDQKTRAFPEDRQRHEQIQTLVQTAKESHLPQGVLDEAVHDAVSAQAARINNGGLTSQVEYLVGEMGATEAGHVLTELIAEYRTSP